MSDKAFSQLLLTTFGSHTADDHNHMQSSELSLQLHDDDTWGLSTLERMNSPISEATLIFLVE